MLIKGKNIKRRRSLILQSLEERILWDATLAPEPESAEVDAEAQVAEEEAVAVEEQPQQDDAQGAAEEQEEIAAASEDDLAVEESGESDAQVADGEVVDETISAAEANEQTDAGSVETISQVDAAGDVADQVAAANLEDLSSDLVDGEDLLSVGSTNTDETDPDAVDVSVSSELDNLESATDSEDSAPRELIIIDSKVDDPDLLVSDILSQRAEGTTPPQIVFLDDDSSGLEQITDILRFAGEVESLHIISHGDDGKLYLGDDTLESDNLASHADLLGTWSEFLTGDADILLYGCNVAETSEGQAFVEQLAEITGADVAASTDDTGTADHNANWEFEFAVGEITAQSAVQVDGNWSGTLPDAEATSTIDTAPDVMIDEEPEISVTFDNTGADTGFAPFIDFVVDPGIDISGGSYLGTPVVDFTVAATWNAAAGQWESPPGTAITTHPFEGDAGGTTDLPLPDGTGFADGATWYSFKLPFGSFVADQPTATIDLDASFNDDAVVGQQINMSSTPGFLLGCDENGDDDPHIGTTVENSTTPSVIQIDKRNDLPESETPTGPNYPVEFTVTVNVAEFETVDNVVVQDFLPANANFIGTAADVSVSTINGGSFTGAPTVTLTGNLLEVDLGSVTGGAGVTGPAAGSGEVEITYFVWFEDIVPETSNNVPSQNESTVSGDYTDGNGNTSTVQDIDDSDVGGPDGGLDDGDVLTDVQNLTTQKTAQVVTGFDGAGNPILGPATELTPGDLLLWTVEIQVSDYHAFDDLVFNDVLSDGQAFVDAGTVPNTNPTLVVNNDTNFGGNTDDSALGLNDFTGAFYTPVFNGATGETTIDFNISDQLVDLGGDGVLVGDLNASLNGVSEDPSETEVTVPVPPRLGPGATTVTLTYYSQVLEDFTDAPGDNAVNSGDDISNDAEISGESGDITDGDGTFTGSGNTLVDDTAVELEIGLPTIEKFIFAVNGVEVQSPNGDEDVNESDEAIIAGIQPGDVITYRLRVEVPSANGENFVVSDFLPLPVYDATEFTGMTFSNTLPAGTPPGEAAVQAALAGSTGGQIFYGEDYSLHTVGADLNIVTPPIGSPHPTDGSYPGVTLNTAANALFFNFGTFEETDLGGDGSEPVVLDLLLNATVQDEAFADGLFLTNQTQLSFDNSEGETFTEEAIVQIAYVAPALTLTKGVVALSGGANASNGSVSPAGPDYGVTYDNTDPGAGPAAGDSVAFDADGVTLDDLAGGLGVLDANATDVDGADWVRYALTVQNTGQGDAQDILISDSLPAQAAGTDGFILPADSTDSAALIAGLNIQVYYGNGDRVADSDLDVSVVGGVLMVEIAAEIDGRTLDAAGNEIADSDEILTDPNPGNDDPSEVQEVVDGDELLIITYDLQLDNDPAAGGDEVVAGDVFTNTATIEEYFQTAEDDPARNDDNNRADLDDPADLTDDATVTTTAPSVEKELIGTELDEPNNGGANEVVIGERLTYQVTVTIPEGQTLNAVLNDSLDGGLELSSIDSITVSNPGALTSDLWGADFAGFDAPLTSPGAGLTYNFVDTGSSSFGLSLGTITNTDTDNTTPEQITISYTVMVTNDVSNVQGAMRNNSASLEFEDSNGDTQESDPDSAEEVVILEPLLEVVKTVDIAGATSTGTDNSQTDPDTVAGDVGDLVTYTIVIDHTTTSTTDASDVNFLDVLPPQLDLASLNLVSATNLAGADLIGVIFDLAGNTLSTIQPFTLDLNDQIEIVVTGVIAPGVTAGDVFDNNAEIDWSSYPDTPAGTDFLEPDQEDVERGGGDNAPAGGELNPYEDEDPARVIVGSNEIEKFLVNTELTNEPDATADGQLAAPDDTDGINSGAEATIGELVTYQVVITLAESMTAGAAIQDSLAPGLALVSIDNLFTQQLDTTTGAVVNTSAVPNLTIANLPTQALGAPVTTPGGIVSYTVDGGTGGGDLITIDLGDIDNMNNDNTILEQIVLQYTVMVTNEGSNVGEGPGLDGTSLTNAAELTWQNGAGEDQTSGVDGAGEIQVIEPDLEVLKDVSVDGPGDAGDEVTYTITIQHTGDSESDAFDVSLYDELPDQVDFSGVVFGGADTNVTVVDSLGVLTTADLEIDAGAGTNGALQFSATGGNTDADTDSAGLPVNTIDLPILPDPGRVITITITGVLEDSVEPGDVISNEAEINYSSLDEQADPGDEDDRSDFVEDQGERDYSDSDPAEDITVPGPEIAKELVGSDVDSDSNAENQATIGEIVTYRITIDVPEGSFDNAEIVDSLTPGLEFVDIVSITGTANGSNVVGSGASPVDLEDETAIPTALTGDSTVGQGITFSFGDILATGDNAGAAPVTGVDQGLDQIIIEYRVVVVDIPSNVDGEVLDNSALFTFETTDEEGNTVEQMTDTVDAEDIEVIEPDLEIVKTINGLADGVAAGPLNAGDTVTYTFVISHTGDSSTDAHDVNFSDAIPPELINVAFVSAVSSGAASGPNGVQPGDIAVNAAGDAIETVNPFTINFNEIVTITVTAQIADAITPNALVENTGEIEYSSLPPGHENDGEGNERGDPSDPDDVYSDDDPAEFFTGVPEFEKNIVSTSIHGDGGDGEPDLTIGETVTYELVVTLQEGTTPVLVTDTLPPLSDPDGVLEVTGAEVSFVGAGITSTNGLLQGATETDSNVIVTDESGDGFDDQVVFDFGVVTVPGDNDPANNIIRVQITAVVKNLPDNADGDELTNTASLNFAADPDNPGAGEVIEDEETIDVIVPELTIDKEFVDPATGDPITDPITVGDTVRIRLVVENTGTANAYDVVVSDPYNIDQPVFVSPTPVLPVPAGFTFNPAPGAAGLGDDAASFNAAPDDFIAPDEILIFEFDVTVTDVELAVDGFDGLTTENTATVIGDSLPGDNPEERDVEDEDTDIIVGDPGLEKTIIDTSVADTGSGQFDPLIDVTIGETVTYQLVVTLPETDINNDGLDDAGEAVLAQLTDTLPTNFDLVSAEVISIGSEIFNSDLMVGDTLSATGIIGVPGDAAITFNIGTISVIDLDDDGDLSEQQIVVNVTAIVVNDPVNAQEVPGVPTSNDKENVATLTYGGEDFEDSATVEVVEPVLEITKNFVDPVTGTPIFTAVAGETIQVELEVENTGSAHAYDVLVTDDLTANVASGFIDTGSAVNVPTPTGTAAAFIYSATGDLIEFTGGTIPPGETVILRFNITLAGDLALGPNDTIENTADVEGDSLPPGDPNEDQQRGTEDDDTDVLFALPAIVKEVADSFVGVPPGDADLEATSNAGTGNGQFDPTLPDLTIGEVVTYEITITIPTTFDDPDLTTVGTSINDVLPAGMALVDARVVAIGGNTTAGDISGGEFFDSGNASVTGGPASSGLAIGDSLVAGSANITGTIGGGSVLFDFGGLAVNDMDTLAGEEQTIVVQVDAVVLDDPINFAGVQQTNGATLTWEETPDEPIILDDTAVVEIVEPEIEIAKTFIDPVTGADVYTVGTGDQVVVVLEVTNSGTSNAYDTLVTDEIDLTNWTIVGPQLTPPGFVYSVEDGANPVPTDTVTFTMTSSGNATDPDFFIEPGETVRIEFVLEYTGAADAGGQIDNTAEATADSIPDDEVVDIPGLDTERDTSDDDSDFVYEDPGLEKVVLQGLNPDTGSDQHDPTLVDLSVGEQVVYELTVTLPESLLDAAGQPIPVDVNLIDDLPDGFALVGAEIINIGSAVSASDLAVGDTLSVLDPTTLGAATPAATDDSDISSSDINLPDGFDDQVVFSFGGVTVADVDDLSLQTITIQVTAVVMDLEPENTDGAVQTNDATLEFFGTPTGDPANPFDTTTPIVIEDSADVEIVEPELEIAKVFLNASGTADVETVTSGDTVTVQLEITNSGTGPAYDVVVSDPLDASQFNIGTISPASVPPGFTFSVTDNVVTFTLDSSAGVPGDPTLVVLPGQTVVLSFTVQVTQDIGPETAVNTATVDGDSAPGDNPFDRDEPTQEATDELNIRPVPDPPEVIINIEDPIAPIPAAVEAPEPFIFVYDVFDLLRDEFDELFQRIRDDIQTELPKTPVHYMATGITEHGSNVTMIVYDESGAILGYTSTLADTAGNWVFSLPQVVLDKSPHHIEVQITPASHNESSSGEFNTRVYFTPATDARAVHYKGLQVGDVIAEKADSIMESIHQGNQTPFGKPGEDWNHPYEFLGTANVENI